MVASLPLYRVLLTGKGRETLISRVSLVRYKDMLDSQTGVERKGSDDSSSEPTKPSLSTFRDDLEIQNLTSPDHRKLGWHFIPARPSQ